MKNPLTLSILPAALLLGTLACSSQDYQIGVDAAKRGDYATALREWKPLADQGHAGAQFNLGWMYRQGKGVPQDFRQAARWTRRSAEQGYAAAMGGLAVMRAAGKGVIQDDILAYMWGNLGAAEGNEFAKKVRDRVSKSMTPSQLQEGQRLSRECLGKNYKGC